MPTPKKSDAEKRIAAPKRRPGYLVCDSCKRTVPYQGMPGSDPAMDGPGHRCRGNAIRPFDRFTLEDPNFVPLPKDVAS